MNIDVVQLAAQTAAFLAPFLPYLIKGGKIAAKKAFEKAGEKFTEEGWEQAKNLWGKLKPKVEAKPAARETVEEFAKDPDEEDAFPALRQQIKKILAEDSNLAKEIFISIENINLSSFQAGDNSVIIGGNVGGNLIKGERNIVVSHGGQIHQTINNFADYDKNSDPKILEEQLINYLRWVEDYFEFIELRGIEQGESPVIRLKLDEVYIPLQAETWHQMEKTNKYGKGA